MSDHNSWEHAWGSGKSARPPSNVAHVPHSRLEDIPGLSLLLVVGLVVFVLRGLFTIFHKIQCRYPNVKRLKFTKR